MFCLTYIHIQYICVTVYMPMKLTPKGWGLYPFN